MISGNFTGDRNAVTRVVGVAGAAQGRITRVLATIMSSLMVLLLGIGLVPAASASAQESAAAPSATRLSGFDRGPASVRVGGQLADTVSVSPKAARTVYVQYRRAGTTRFTTAYKAKTSAQGWFTAFLMPRSAGTWQFRVVVVATTRAKAVVSPLRTVKASGRAVPTKIMGFSTNRSTITAGNTVRDAISVSPRASRLVEVQARRAGTSTWVKTSASGRSTTAGNFTAVYRPSVGVWQYRLVVRANSKARTADGSYTVARLPAADYQVCFDSGGYAPECYDDQPSGAGTPVAVAQGVATPGIDATLYEAGTGAVSGTVTDAAGAPDLAQVEVTVSSDSTGFFGEALTAADGSYTVVGLPTGTDYQVCFEGFGATVESLFMYASECYDNQPSPGTATPVTVTSGATTSGIDVTLDRVGDGGVSGTVTDAAGTQDLANVLVTVYSPSLGASQSAYTAANGSYYVGSLAAGADYQVCFEGGEATGGSARGYADQCWENQPIFTTTTPVAVAPGATTPGIDAALDEAGAVSGTVTDADGQPMANVEVTVYVPFNVSVGYVDTAADGTYTVTGIPAGNYKVCFDAGLPPGSVNGYVSECYDNQTFDAPTLVTVALGATTSGIDAALDEAGSVSGTVTDAVTGLPLADVWVTVSQGGPIPESPGANTAADGTYKVAGLSAGDYQVCFRGWGASVGYVYECYDSQPTPGTPTPVTVVQGVARTGVDATLD